MGKWNDMRKKKWMLLSVLLCMSAGIALSGCGSQDKKQVLAEKTQESPQEGDSQETSDSLGASDSQGTSAEDSSRQGKPGAGNQGEGSIHNEAGTENGGGDVKADSHTLLELVEAPKQYDTQVEGKQVQLSADADVEVPAVNKIPILEAKKEPWSDDDFAKFKRLTAEAAGIQWAEDQPRDNGVIDVLSQDGNYQLSFVDGEQEGSTPILWMKHLYLLAGNGAEFEGGEQSQAALSEGKKNDAENQIKTKADQFLAAMDQGDFVRKDSKWKIVKGGGGAADSAEAGAQAEGADSGISGSQYGLLLKYAKTYRGVPVTGRVQTLMGESAPSGQYVEFFYTTDGTLLEVKAIGREVEAGSGADDRFLLPFAAVTQIFEQYCKTYSAGDIGLAGDFGSAGDVDSTGNAASAGGVGSALAGDSAFEGNTAILLPIENAEETKTHIYVDKVSLEYRHEQDTSQQFPEGRLVPVWNFYGRVGGNVENETILMEGGNPVQNEKEGILVSINAEDGTIYGK